MVKKRKSTSQGLSSKQKKRELEVQKPPSSSDESESSSEEEQNDTESSSPSPSQSESESDHSSLESKRETIRKLLQPFGKDQLINILKEAASTDPSIASEIVSAADSDSVHRKIFVHGLGWDANTETLISAFKQYGPIQECNVVTDKATGRSKGYGFVLFETRAAARKALKQPQKKIGIRMASCQLASTGPSVNQNQNQNPSDNSARKLFVSNVGPQVDAERLRAFFAKFGEIEEGPLGLDKVTGKFRGFAMIVYKNAEGINKALEEPLKVFDGVSLQCSVATEGKTGKINAANAALVPGNIAIPGFIGQNLNPGAFLLGQNPALGVFNPVFGLSGGISQSLDRVPNMGATGFSAGFGVQPSINTVSPNVIGSYGSQAALQGFGAYRTSQLGQSSASGAAAARSQTGMGSVPFYGR